MRYKQFEYRTDMVINNRIDSLAIYLNEVGQEGWECVSVNNNGFRDGSLGVANYDIVLKREKKKEFNLTEY